MFAALCDHTKVFILSSSTLWQRIFSRRMVLCVLTGFASGLPLYVLINLLPAWLRSSQVDLAAIGLMSLVQFPYAWKFLWAPFLDRFELPLLGLRRGWLLLTQLALLILIAAIGQFSPVGQLHYIVIFASAVAVFSATQDIVLDAYRREILPDDELGLGNSIHVNAYKISGLIPGSLALILTSFMAWNHIFMVVALFMLVGVALTVFAPEPTHYHARPSSLKSAVIEPFMEFFQRQGWRLALLTLAFMCLYKLGDQLAVSLLTPFYLDMGYSNPEIGAVAKYAGLSASVAGGIIGGVLMLTISINRALWLFGVVQLSSLLLFSWFAERGTQQHDLFVLALVVAYENFAFGLGTAAFTAYIARSSSIRFAATQLALLTALTSVPRVFFSSITGFIVEATGWPVFFLWCAAAAIPGMLLLFKVAPWRQ